MELRYLETFVTVAEVGSIAQASRRLGLTAAAIGARLHALESDLGAQLVRRIGRSVRPTDAGLRILPRAQALLRETRDLKAAAADSSEPGELRLGVFVSAMTSVLPHVLRRLYWDHPALRIYVEPGKSADLCQQVEQGRLDAAIVIEPQQAIGKACEWKVLVEEPLVVVAPKALATDDPHHLLRSQPFIRYDRNVRGGQLAERYLRDHAIQPLERLEIDGLMAIGAMVAEGLGVSLLPDWSPLWSGQLPIARVPLPGRSPVRRVGIVWRPHGARVSLARALVSAAVAEFC